MEGSALSPLAEIERAVQERAKDISLEMSGPDGEAKLRGLNDDDVWEIMVNAPDSVFVRSTTPTSGWAS